jgi:hypothetical protein
VVPSELIRYRITKGGIVKDHEDVMRFTRQGDGSRLDYTISFRRKVPGIGPIVKLSLRRSVTSPLGKLAAGGPITS